MDAERDIRAGWSASGHSLEWRHTVKHKIPPAEFKQHIAELQSRAEALADVLTRILEEGKALAGRAGKEIDWHWVEQALANIRAYQKELSAAAAARDAKLLLHAARKFASIRKYFEDSAPDWSNRHDELLRQASMTADKGGEIASSIDPFDPVNLADIQRSL